MGGSSGLGRAILPVEIGGAWLALGAAAVREVLGERPWLSLPGARGPVPGVMAWQGRAVAVVDLGALVGATLLAPGARRRRIVIAEHDGHTLALPVDGVREVQELPAEAIRPPRVTRQRLSAGEIDIGDAVAPLLDLEALVKELVAESVAR